MKTTTVDPNDQELSSLSVGGGYLRLIPETALEAALLYNIVNNAAQGICDNGVVVAEGVKPLLNSDGEYNGWHRILFRPAYIDPFEEPVEGRVCVCAKDISYRRTHQNDDDDECHLHPWASLWESEVLWQIPASKYGDAQYDFTPSRPFFTPKGGW